MSVSQKVQLPVVYSKTSATCVQCPCTNYDFALDQREAKCMAQLVHNIFSLI